jgi:hypothetical protein
LFSIKTDYPVSSKKRREVETERRAESRGKRHNINYIRILRSLMRAWAPFQKHRRKGPSQESTKDRGTEGVNNKHENTAAYADSMVRDGALLEGERFRRLEAGAGQAGEGQAVKLD